LSFCPFFFLSPPKGGLVPFNLVVIFSLNLSNESGGFGGPHPFFPPMIFLFLFSFGYFVAGSVKDFFWLFCLVGPF